VEHAADLRHRDVRFVDDEQIVLGEIIDQGRGALPRLAAAKVARIILDARAVTDLLHHLQVEAGTLLEPLGFEQFVAAAEIGKAGLQFLLDPFHGLFEPFRRGDKMFGRIDRHRIGLALDLAGEGIDHRDAFDLITEHLDADRLAFVGGDHLDDIPAHAEGAAVEIDVVAGIVDLDQFLQDDVAFDLLAGLEDDQHFQPIFGRTQAVNAGDRGDDDYIAAGKQRGSSPQPQPVNFVIDRGILFDIGIGMGKIGLGLIIVVVADEILDCIVREKTAELAIELGRQGLVVRNDQGWTVDAGDDVGHGEGLATPGHPEQGLVDIPALQSLDEFFDRLGLVTLEGKRGFQFETIHALSSRWAKNRFQAINVL